MESVTSMGAFEGSVPIHPTVAYLILSHKDPAQVEALAARILRLSSKSLVVVHHDLNAATVPWGGDAPERVHLVDRTRVEWGGWSIVEATLRLIRFAVERLNADWLVVLSGEHWPVTDLELWETTLSRCRADALLPGESLPRRLHFGRQNLDGNRFLALYPPLGEVSPTSQQSRSQGARRFFENIPSDAPGAQARILLAQ